VQVTPTPSTIPGSATQSESVFLQEINSIEPKTLVAQTAYNDINAAYGGSLGLGAAVAVDGTTIFATVYEPATTTTLMVHPV
jgi:hypothetical protein